MPKEIVLTKQGLDELKAKISFLSNERRREVAARIKEAREFGDISENAEYDDAKNEQAMLEKQIADLEEKLRSAKVIDAKQTVEYHIVGSAEANPSENKLSNESPVGRAIIGKKKGEVVEVSAPRGALKFKIMEIKAA